MFCSLNSAGLTEVTFFIDQISAWKTTSVPTSLNNLDVFNCVGNKSTQVVECVCGFNNQSELIGAWDE